MMVAVLDCIRDTYRHGVTWYDPITAIAVHGCAYTPAFASTEVPCVTLRILLVDDDGTPKGAQRSCIVVEGPMHALVGRYQWLYL